MNNSVFDVEFRKAIIRVTIAKGLIRILFNARIINNEGTKKTSISFAHKWKFGILYNFTSLMFPQIGVDTVS